MRRNNTLTGLDGPLLRRSREGLIDGLKVAMEGEEIILILEDRIEHYRGVLQRRREAAGIEWANEPDTVFAEGRIRTLSMIRDHIWEGYTYLLSKEDLEFAELLPQP